jgi:hypothetical protein
MVQYNRSLGKTICDRYLSENPQLLAHSYKCGELCYELAMKILAKNPEFEKELDPETMGFLGYTHNIGTLVSRDKHELHTMYLLTTKEGVPENIAIKTRHGQLVEDYDDPKYYPIGLEGILLTYVDVSVRPHHPDGEILPMKDRVNEMLKLMQTRESVFVKYTDEMVAKFKKAIPRYLRYERIIQSLLAN